MSPVDCQIGQTVYFVVSGGKIWAEHEVLVGVVRGWNSEVGAFEIEVEGDAELWIVSARRVYGNRGRAEKRLKSLTQEAWACYNARSNLARTRFHQFKGVGK